MIYFGGNLSSIYYARWLHCVGLFSWQDTFIDLSTGGMSCEYSLNAYLQF